MNELAQMVTGLYGRTREQHSNTHTIHSTHFIWKK